MSSAHLAVTLGMAIFLSHTFLTVPAPVVEPISPIELILIFNFFFFFLIGSVLVLIWTELTILVRLG